MWKEHNRIECDSDLITLVAFIGLQKFGILVLFPTLECFRIYLMLVASDSRYRNFEIAESLVVPLDLEFCGVMGAVSIARVPCIAQCAVTQERHHYTAAPPERPKEQNTAPQTVIISIVTHRLLLQVMIRTLATIAIVSICKNSAFIINDYGILTLQVRCICAYSRSLAKQTLSIASTSQVEKIPSRSSARSRTA
jgi:hypothetical protein